MSGLIFIDMYLIVIAIPLEEVLLLYFIYFSIFVLFFFIFFPLVYENVETESFLIATFQSFRLENYDIFNFRTIDN